MKKVFFDTSAIYAYINRKDPDHERTKKAVKGIRSGLVITNYILDEAITLLQARLGHHAAVEIGEVLLHAPEIERCQITANDEMESWRLFKERPDKRYSFTDCTSFTVMKRLNITRALALDEHFRREGFRIII